LKRTTTGPRQATGETFEEGKKVKKELDNAKLGRVKGAAETDFGNRFPVAQHFAFIGVATL
jgi:hypothetical protein